MKIVIVDVESSGLPGKGMTYEKDFLDFPRIVSIAWKVNNSGTRYYVINQEGFKIPEEAIAIHGITNEMCADSQYILSVVLRVFEKEAIGADLVVGHNLYFDTATIKASILRMIHSGVWDKCSFDTFTDILHKDKRIDTMRKSTSYCALPNNKWPKLTELHQKLFDCGFNAHNCRDDVDATYKCFHKLVEFGVIKLPWDKMEEK